MTRSVVNPGRLLWSGEHWVNYLRTPSAESDSGMVSIYHTRYSTAGEGNVAFVDIPGKVGFTGICTDNRELTIFIIDTMIRGRAIPFDRPLIVLDAKVLRGGDIHVAPYWSIETDRDRILVTWKDIQPPMVVEGFASTFDKDMDFFSVLFFAEDASTQLNDHSIAGNPHPRRIWLKSIGEYPKFLYVCPR